MSLRETLSKKLSSEQMSAIEDALGDDFDYDVVPRSRLNKVIKQRNELRELQAAGNAGTQTAPVDDDDDDDTTTGGKGKQQVTGMSDKEHKRAMKELEDKHAAELTALKIQYAALDKLRAANAIDPELVFNSGVLDKSKLKFDDKGVLQGLDEQVAELTKSKGFLFQAGKGAHSGTGRGSDGGGGQDTGALDSQLANVFAGFGITPVTPGK